MNEVNEKNNYNIEEAIVSAIAFFDMFDYPLTDFEIWKFVNIKCNLSDIREALKELSSEASELSSIQNKNGFYFLRGRSDIIETRLKRYAYADRKFKRAMRVVRVFKLIPWIKMIAVSNVIGAHNLKDGSDIDLFIITAKKKIWLTRFFCISIAQMLGLRPKEGDTRDKICLNFYVSEEAMDLESLMLCDQAPTAGRRSLTSDIHTVLGEKDVAGLETLPPAVGCGVSPSTRFIDIYFIYWLVNLIPIYEVDGMYKKFIRENNWIDNYFPNWLPVKMERRRYVCRPSGSASAQAPRVCKRFNLLNLFNCFENKFKKLQLKLMPDNLKELMNKDTKVVVSDSVLKLHINDRRGEYKKNYELRIKNYEL